MHKIKFLLILTTVILGFFLPRYLGVSLALPYNENIDNDFPLLQESMLYFNSTPPIIDGNFSSFTGEWENATIITTEFGTTLITIRAQANYTHLFMGISYTSSIYVPINTTIPVGDTYNNESHTWYSIVFDRNFDERIGSSLSADDAILINYRAEGSQDAFINGTTNNSLILDVDVGGIENSVSAMSEYEDDFHDHVFSIEVAKELKSGDTNGEDIYMNQGETISFLMLIFENQTAFYNYSVSWLSPAITPWEVIRLNILYDYFSYVSDVKDLDVLFYVTDATSTNYQNFTSFSNLLKQYGMNVTIKTSTSGYEIRPDRITEVDLIILIGGHSTLNSAEIETIRSYVANGRSLMILGDPTKYGSQLNKLVTNFGFEFYTSTLYSKNTAINSSLTVDSSEIIDLPYLKDETALTNYTVDNFDYIGSAINFTDEIGEGIYSFQEGDLYATFNKTGDYYIDSDDDGVFNATNDISLNDSASLQVALELQRGGKLLACASADIFNNSYFVEKSIQYLLLRELQWLLNFQHLISYDNFNILNSTVPEGEEIRMNITVTGDNDTVLEGVRVWVVYQELKTDKNQSDLTNLDDSVIYNGSIIPEGVRAKYVDISIRMHKRGHGYNETALYEIYIETDLRGSINIDVVALIIFIVSLGLAGLGAFALRKNRQS